MLLPATSPCVVAALADAAIFQTLEQAARHSALPMVAAPPEPSSPFLALIDSALPDRSAQATRFAAQESCRALLFLGTAPEMDFALPVRVVEQPVRLATLLAFCEKTWQALHQPPRALCPGFLFDPRGRFLLREADAARAVLTAKEAEMLEILLSAGEAGVAREFLLQEVWRYGAGLETHTLETHIYRLRQKLEKLACPLTLRMEQGRCKLSA
jgi:quinol monooxygenase YgiN